MLGQWRRRMGFWNKKIGVVFAFLLVGGLWWGCCSLLKRSEIVPLSSESLVEGELTQAPLGMLGVDFYESVENKKHWNVRARFAELHRKENYAFLKEVRAVFFAERTGNQVETFSDFARSHLDSQVMDLEGNVTIRSKRGYLFEMPRLGYDGKEHLFFSDDTVEMRGPDLKNPTMFLKGRGLKGNIDSEQFLVRKNVSARRLLKTAEWIRIVSETGEFFTEDQRAVFNGDVHSVLPKIQLESDQMELSIVEGRESVSAYGNVRLTRNQLKGAAQKVFLEVGSNKIILEGKARVDSKDNEIRGKRIILYTDEEKVEVQGAEGRMGQP